jgi:uncharacterized repeat protein (TIGR01451 family)
MTRPTTPDQMKRTHILRRRRPSSRAAAIAPVLASLALALIPSAAAGGQLSADIAVTGTASGAQATVGQNLSFVVTVENKGPEVATAVKLTDVVAGRVKLVSGVSNHGKCFKSTGKFTCALGKLIKGETAQFTAVVVPTADGIVTNTASAGGQQSDPDTSNQLAQVNVDAVFVDPTAPVNPVVHVNNRLSAPVFTVATAFPVRWTATDAESGLASFDVRYREARPGRSFGRYVDWQKGASTIRVASFKARPGSTYCFSTRATNKAGVSSSWGPEACTSVPLGALALAPPKPWVKATGRSYYLGTSIAASDRGAKLSRRVVGARQIDLVATRCPGCGAVYVLWNGKLLRRVSLGGEMVRRGALIPLVVFRAARSGTLRIEIASTGRSVRIEGIAISRV